MRMTCRKEWVKMEKTKHEEVSLGTKPEDQGWELSPCSPEGVQNRYLSAKSTAGGCCFAGGVGCRLAGVQLPRRPHSDAAGC